LPTALRQITARLSLGQNVLVNVYALGRIQTLKTRFLMSEWLVKEDKFTSIHIEEFESVVARETKLGREEITRDIPNVGEETLKDLDESGIIRNWSRGKARGHSRWKDLSERGDSAFPLRSGS